MSKEENYAIHSSHPMNPDKYSECVCMNCFSRYYIPKILGDDNTYRMLPGRCRLCSPSGLVSIESDKFTKAKTTDDLINDIVLVLEAYGYTEHTFNHLGHNGDVKYLHLQIDTTGRKEG